MKPSPPPMRSSTSISRGSSTNHFPSARRIAPQRWRPAETTCRSVVANIFAFLYFLATVSIMPLKLSIFPARSLPPASGPFMPRQSWKSSSFPTRMSATDAIWWNALASSASRPFQNVAR